MSEIKKIKVSELLEEPDGKGFWIFGYNVVGGKHVSRRFSFDKLKKVIDDAAKSIQLERRIAVAFERPQQLIPIGEPLTIEKVVARNVTKLEYKENRANNETWIDIPVNVDLGKGIRLNGNYDIIVKINSDQENVTFCDYDKYSTITIFAKADKK